MGPQYNGDENSKEVVISYWWLLWNRVQGKGMMMTITNRQQGRQFNKTKPGTKWCGECWSSTHSPASASWQRLKFVAILHQSSMHCNDQITNIIDIEYRPGDQPRGNNGAGVRLRLVGQWVFLWQACITDPSTHYDANDYYLYYHYYLHYVLFLDRHPRSFNTILNFYRYQTKKK